MLTKVNVSVAWAARTEPPFGKRLAAAEIQAVSTYVQSLGAGS
jgi:hypothetical protein